MSALLSKPDLSRFRVEVICYKKGRGAESMGDGCLAHLIFFAKDIQTTAKPGSLFASCPNCGKVLVFRDEEIPTQIRVALSLGNIPDPDPELLKFFSGWETVITCGEGGENNRRSPGCKRKFTITAADVRYSSGSDYVNWTATCPYCDKVHFFRLDDLPAFVARGARMRNQVMYHS